MQSPFKSDVHFFSTRQKLHRRWGTTQPKTIRDKDFGVVRLRAFGNHADGINDAVAQSGLPLLDLAANQVEFARQLQDATAAEAPYRRVAVGQCTAAQLPRGLPKLRRAYVFAFDAPLPADAPQNSVGLDTLLAGQRTLADGRAWDVASCVRARLIAAQGELPTLDASNHSRPKVRQPQCHHRFRGCRDSLCPAVALRP